MPPRRGCTNHKHNNRGNHVGFCFVNFTTPQYAAAFASRIDSFRFNGSERRVSVKRAKCQGFEENMLQDIVLGHIRWTRFPVSELM